MILFIKAFLKNSFRRNPLSRSWLRHTLILTPTLQIKNSKLFCHSYTYTSYPYCKGLIFSFLSISSKMHLDRRSLTRRAETGNPVRTISSNKISTCHHHLLFQTIANKSSSNIYLQKVYASKQRAYSA